MQDDVETCRRKVSALLDEASQTENFGERSRLISEATRWHRRAEEASWECRASDGGKPIGGC